MATETAPTAAKSESRSNLLSILLAMAMFVLVIDTSMMNVSISSIVRDLNTTASGVQSAIALEALVSGAFILVGSKLGDLFGRKRAYTLGLAGYAVGALAMMLAQGLTAIIIFWAIIGGLGASMLLPAMQSLIHGNFEGAAQKRAYALVGAATGIAAAVGPLLGGFITTYLSWRVGFLLEFVIIAIVLANLGLIKDVPYTGPRKIDIVGGILSALGMGGIVLSILVWQEGGAYVGLLMLIGVVAMFFFVRWLLRQKAKGETPLIDPDLFSSKYFRLGVSGQLLQNVTLGGMMIALPLYFQMVFEYTAMQTGIAIAPLSISIFIIALLMGRMAGKRRGSRLIQIGFALLCVGIPFLIFNVPRAASNWDFFIPLTIAGAGLGLLVSQLNNYTLSPITEERVSEAAGVNSAAGSFGLSFGLAAAGAIMLAALAISFTNMSQASTVLAPEQQEQVAVALEEDAQILSDTQVTELLVGQTPEVQEEIIRINTDARNIALQIALLVPLLASALGLANSFRMVSLPEPEALSSTEGLLGG
jgi:EmrB/QacA subfamily drug resistance transporter